MTSFIKSTIAIFVLVVASPTLNAIAGSIGTYTNRHTYKSLTTRYAYGFSTSFIFFAPNSELLKQYEEAGQELPPKILKFEPNIEYYQSPGISYKWFSFALSFPIEKGAVSKRAKGASKATDYKLTFNTSFFLASAYYQDFKGMFQTDPYDVTYEDDEERYTKQENLGLHKVGAEIIFKIFPKSFSLGALCDQSEIQTKSGGSPLIRLTKNSFSLKNSGIPIIPVKYQTFYPIDGGLHELNAEEYSVGVGYGYTFVFMKSIFLGAALSYGNSQVEGSYMVGEEKKSFSSNNLLGSRYSLFSLGVNSKKIFGGISLIIDSIDIRLDEFSITTPRNIGEMYLGWRF